MKKAVAKASEGLTKSQEAEFEMLDAVVWKNRENFKATVEALQKIHDGELWREDYFSFKDYCEKRVGLSRQRVYKILSEESVQKPRKSVQNTNEVPFQVSTRLTPNDESLANTEVTTQKHNETKQNVGMSVSEFRLASKLLRDRVPADSDWSKYGAVANDELVKPLMNQNMRKEFNAYGR